MYIYAFNEWAKESCSIHIYARIYTYTYTYTYILSLNGPKKTAPLTKEYRALTLSPVCVCMRVFAHVCTQNNLCVYMYTYIYAQCEIYVRNNACVYLTRTHAFVCIHVCCIHMPVCRHTYGTSPTCVCV